MPSALVLSAGGMFGAYQAGVWNVLSQRFQPDMVVGTSAGALNGWAIASGCSPAASAAQRDLHQRARFALGALYGWAAPDRILYSSLAFPFRPRWWNFHAYAWCAYRMSGSPRRISWLPARCRSGTRPFVSMANSTSMEVCWTYCPSGPRRKWEPPASSR